MSFRLPSWTVPIRVVVLGSALLVSGYLYANRDLVGTYIDNAKEGKGDVTFDFRELSEQMTEKELLTRYANLNLYCADDQRAPDLGTRACWSQIRTFHQHQALHVVFFLTAGRLSWAKIDVPWWSHSQVGRELIKQYGRPAGVQNLSCVDMLLVAWQFSSGSLFIEAAPDSNPLQWSTINWVSPSKCKEACLPLSLANLPSWTR